MILNSILLIFTAFLAQADGAFEVLCDYSFENRVIDLSVEQNYSCVSDLVHSSENVCFTGDIQKVLEFLNSGQLGSISSGLRVRDAKVEDDELIFTGVDAQVFYRRQSSLKRCQD